MAPQLLSERTEKKTTRRMPVYESYATDFLEDVRTVYHAGQFLVYAGDHYRVEGDMALAVRQWLLRQQVPVTNALVAQIHPLVAAIARVDREAQPRLPFFLGTAPSRPEDIVAYRNGLLDVGRFVAGEVALGPHTPDWVSTTVLPYEFDPDAACPNWLGFLDEVFDGDAERVALLQEYCGYLLTGDTRFHKFMVFCGLPRAGKGTINRVQQSLVGDGNWAAFDLGRLTERFATYTLRDKLLAVVGEVELSNAREKNKICEQLKSITGGDPILVERKGDPNLYSVGLPTRFVIDCNQMPHFYDNSGALAQRMLVLNFDRSFAGREDTSLFEGKLLPEIRGISVWALRGLARLRTAGRFTTPTRMAKCLEEFRTDAAPTLRFVRECCVVEAGVDPGTLGEVAVGAGPLHAGNEDLADVYRWWSQESVSPVWLSRNLLGLIPKLERVTRRKGKQVMRVIRGLGLKPEVLDAVRAPGLPG